MDQKLIEILIQAKDNASGAIAATATSLDTLNDKQNDMINTATKATAIVGVLGGVALAGVAAYGLYAAGSMQQASIGMTNLLGNAQLANQVFGQLAVYANNTPFTFADIRSAAQTLLGFGFGGQAAVDMIKKMGDVAAASGGNITDMALVTGQIFAQGKLRAQDLYQVINDGGAGVVKIMAANAGGMQKLTDEFNTGGIPAQQYFDAINQATATGGFAFQGAQNQAATFNGRLSTLKDAATQLAEKLVGVNVTAQGLTIDPNGLFMKASNAVLGLINALNGFPAWWDKNKGTIELIGGAIAGALLGLAAAWVIVNAAQIAAAISAAIALLPYILIGAAVGALAVLIVTHWTQIQAFLLGVWTAIKDDAERVWNAFIATNEAIANTVVDAWKATVSFFVGIWNAIVAATVRAWNDIVAAVKIAIAAIWQVFKPFYDAFVAVNLALIAVWVYIFDVIRGLWIVTWNFLWANVVKPTIDLIVSAINFLVPVFVAVWNDVVAGAIVVWNLLWNNIIKPVIDGVVMGFQTIAAIAKVVWGGIEAVAIAVWGAISGAAVAAWNFIVGVWDGAVKWFTGIFNSLIGPAKSAGSAMGSAMGSAFSDAFNGVISVVKGAINLLISGVNVIINTLNASAGKLPGVPKIANIPHFAQGGWVPGAPGQPQLAVVHGGEYVMSRDMLNRSGGAQGGAGGGNHYEVHIHTPAVVGNKRDLAQYVWQGLQQIDRANGTPQLPNIGVRPA